MNPAIQDAIEREIVVRASRESVYAALTTPDGLALWFPERVEGKLEPGERPIFDFGKYGRFTMYIVAAVPFEYFAFRGVPGSIYVPAGFDGDVLAHPNTLVEFRLEDVPGGTRIKLKESGFASLPAEFYEKAFADNTGGWEIVMGRLAKLLDPA